MLNLEYPDDDTEREFQHPISQAVVTEVYDDVEPRCSLSEFHSRLEVVQSAFENELQKEVSALYDPLSMFGRVGNRMGMGGPSPYNRRLFLEEGHHHYERFRGRERVDALARAREELGEGASEREIEERARQVREESSEAITMDGTVEEAPLTFGVWEAVSSLLGFDEESADVGAVKQAHEVEYYSAVDTKTKYATSGFVVGVPDMYLSGMKAEQRVFSALVDTEMEPESIVDAYGNRVSYPDDYEWAVKRGASREEVSESRSEARKVLREWYPEGTIPEYLIPE